MKIRIEGPFLYQNPENLHRSLYQNTKIVKTDTVPGGASPGPNLYIVHPLARLFMFSIVIHYDKVYFDCLHDYAHLLTKPLLSCLSSTTMQIVLIFCPKTKHPR